MRWPDLLPAGLLLVASAAAAQEVVILPESVLPGELVSLTIGGPDAERLVGAEVAGERLHLHAVAEGHVALAGIPVEATDSIAVQLHLRTRRGEDTVVVWMPVRGATFRERKLTVAPSMARPDSAASERIRSEVARAYALARASHDTPRLDGPPFSLPRESATTAAFGDARTWNGQVQSRHLGVDLAGRVGDPVLAPGRAVVALVDTFYLGGTVVYLDHGEGLTTGYLHLSRALVAHGDTVEVGQPIGRVGRSGRATGPHLHWVMRFGEVAVDPLSATRLD